VTVTLPKGGNLLLADEAPGIEQVRVGLGWSTAPGSGAIELDGVLSLIDNSGPNGRLLLAHQVPNPAELVGTHPPSGPVVGDVEKLVVTLPAVPSAVTRIVFGVAIYDAANRRQTFRSVRGAYIRVVNDANGIEVARYTLEPETGAESAMIFGELYRNPRGWKFRAVGQGYSTGLRGIAGVGTGEPATARPVDISGYVRRTSPARSRRSLAEHLSPPKPVAPKPVVRAAEPPKPVSPKPVSPKPPAPQPSAPARPPAAAPPRPNLPPPAAPARPAARSSLDLSPPEPSATASTRSTGSPTSGLAASLAAAARVLFGEHSSRYRQRMEHVSVLDDGHPATTWTEEQRGSGAMTVTLRWEPLQTSSGLPRPSDLQLGCFWQAGDGAAGVVQNIGNLTSAPGALSSRQVLRLGRRDERDGQVLFVDLAALSTFRRFFVFAYGLHGSPEWAAQRPVLTVAAPSGEQLTIRLGDAPTSARLCVVASFHIFQGDLIIRRENDYFDGAQSEAAARYGWTLEWNPDGMSLRTVP
jgi:stress response protein SCP2/uncharacterized protein involved in tellurium resistance